MTWSEVSPGHYQRPIGENESMIKIFGDRGHALGREHWSISSFASFKASGSLGGEALSLKFYQAWKAFRFQHPSIASIPKEDMLEYITPDAEGLKKWADETFFVHDEDISVDELISTLKPNPYASLHYLSRSSQVVLHTAHWRTDGIGAQQLLNAFFEQVISDQGADQLPWGAEHERLVPNIEEVLNIPLTPTPEITATTQQFFQLGMANAGGITLSYDGDENKLPSGTRGAQLLLPQSTTELILKACQERGITITAAVHAAVAAIAYTEAPSDSKQKHYTSTMRFSLRPYLPEPYSAPLYASALYTSGITAKVSASQSWLENAKQYSEQYQRGLTNEFLQARRQFAIQMQAILKNLGPNAPRPSELDISSLEYPEPLMKPVHQGKESALEVLTMGFTVETLTRQMYCCTWLFRNQLGFNLTYNEAYYSADRVTTMLNRLVDILQAELQIHN
ncbi:hypothetical protein F5884DRAFT_686620 [Xylogone sp. PMI_703]|nr:hypothetical protein F5884DRAFT_686620 [Xylogone sp. PMI_703]